MWPWVLSRNFQPRKKMGGSEHGGFTSKLIRIEQKSRTHEAGCWMAFRDFFVAFRFRESQMMKYDEIWLNAASLELSSTADRELRLTSGSGQVPELGESPSPARDNMCLICVLVDGDWNHGILWLSMYWECHHPNWLSLHHFSEGLVETTNQCLMRRAFWTYLRLRTLRNRWIWLVFCVSFSPHPRGGGSEAASLVLIVPVATASLTL